MIFNIYKITTILGMAELKKFFKIKSSENSAKN